MERRKKQKILSILGVAILIIAVTGVTYAFFNYTRTGSENVLAVGRIYFASSQGTAINLTNVFPVKSTELANNPNVSSVTLTVTGDTTYNQGIEYLISADQVVNTINGKKVPIGVSVVVTNLGTSDDSYFTNRGGNTSLYKNIAKETIKEDGELVAGYITSGVAGVNGSVTVTAYIDADRIAISDTYDGTESDNNGTTNNWVDDRVVLTTTEWNSLQTNGVSFKLRVEANEGIWVPEPLTAYTQIRRNVNTTTTINFRNISSSSNGEGLYILPGTENDTNPIYYYRGAVTDNNVIFGGFCWQMVRTTETGGIKMIYNGVATDDGTTCTNTAHSDRILTSTSAFNSSWSSLSDVGYMSNTRYSFKSTSAQANSIYGKNIEWHTDHYLVIENTENTASTNDTKDNEHHYSCGIAEATICDVARYYYYNNYFITLSSDDLLDDAIYKMTGNGSATTKLKNTGYNLNENNSTIKDAIDTWFRTNLTNEVNLSNPDYSIYIEDTVYCNDRSFKTVTGNTSNPTYEESGWNPLEGDLTKTVFFGTLNRWYNNNWYSTINVPTVKNTGEIPHIACPNETDRFTVSSSIGNGALTYPVGLLTVDEIIMAGGHGNGTDSNQNYYLYTGGYFWSLSPYRFSTNNMATITTVGSNGDLRGHDVQDSMGVRPVISLKPGIEFETGGEGTAAKPYVVKYN